MFWDFWFAGFFGSFKNTGSRKKEKPGNTLPCCSSDSKVKAGLPVQLSVTFECSLCSVRGFAHTWRERGKTCQPQGPGLEVSDGSLPGFASENELS